MFFSPKISFEASNRGFLLQTKISSCIQILSLKHIGCLLGRSPPLSASPFARLNTPTCFLSVQLVQGVGISIYQAKKVCY